MAVQRQFLRQGTNLLYLCKTSRSHCGHYLSLTQDSHSESSKLFNPIERMGLNLNSSFSMIALLPNIYLFADQRFRSNMIERWPIFLLGRNPQKQYGLVSWLESAQLYNTVIIFLEKGVKSHFSLDVAMAHDLTPC